MHLQTKISADVLADALVDYGLSTSTAVTYAERIIDMMKRGVTEEQAEMYLKSAGWYNKELVALYKNIQDIVEVQEQENNMADNKNTNTQNLLAEMLSALVAEFADAAGFRARAETESGAEYKKALVKFIATNKAVVQSVAMADLDECKKLAGELFERLTQL